MATFPTGHRWCLIARTIRRRRTRRPPARHIPHAVAAFHLTHASVATGQLQLASERGRPHGAHANPRRSGAAAPAASAVPRAHKRRPPPDRVAPVRPACTPSPALAAACLPLDPPQPRCTPARTAQTRPMRAVTVLRAVAAGCGSTTCTCAPLPSTPSHPTAPATTSAWWARRPANGP